MAVPCPFGIESTGRRLRRTPGRFYLRPGAVPRSTIENILGPLGEAAGGIVQAPGMLASHYAPRARLRLNATGGSPGEACWLLARVSCRMRTSFHNLSPSGDLQEAAANLFTMLRSWTAQAPILSP
jgi:L-threonylcarbamoyladenylate synthase